MCFSLFNIKICISSSWCIYVFYTEQCWPSGRIVETQCVYSEVRTEFFYKLGLSLHYLGFLLLGSFHQCFILIFIQILLLSVGHMMKSVNLQQSSAPLGTKDHWNEMFFYIIFQVLVRGMDKF